MKILEAQSAVLTNYEVYQHVAEQTSRNKKIRRRPPPNNATIMHELLSYMNNKVNPLSQKPSAYKPKCIPELMDRLRPYDLSKGELVMLFNLRPASVPALNTIIEDMGDRFEEHQPEEIIEIIAEVLGFFPVPEEEEAQNGADEGGDVAMGEAEAAPQS